MQHSIKWKKKKKEHGTNDEAVEYFQVHLFQKLLIAQVYYVS